MAPCKQLSTSDRTEREAAFSCLPQDAATNAEVAEPGCEVRKYQKTIKTINL